MLKIRIILKMVRNEIVLRVFKTAVFWGRLRGNAKRFYIDIKNAWVKGYRAGKG